MTIIETYNGGVPYATGTKLTPADANKFETNARRNALAARTAWIIGGDTERSGTTPVYLWPSPYLDKLLIARASELYSLDVTSTGLAMVAQGTTGVSSGGYVMGSDAALRGVELVGLTDWTELEYSSDGGATIGSSSLAGIGDGYATGQPQWLGGDNHVRIAPGVITGVGDGYTTLLIGSGSTTYTDNGSSTELGPAWCCAGSASGSAQHAVVLSAGGVVYGDPLASMSQASLPAPVSPAPATDCQYGLCWDATLSLYVMTCHTEDDTVAFCTSPTGATWTDWRHVDVGDGSVTVVGAEPAGEVLNTPVIAIDGAWFVLRGKHSGAEAGPVHSLICSLDAGASWFDMSLPPLIYTKYAHMVEFGGRLVIGSPYGCMMSSLIAEPTSVSSVAV
jgi:hypothetical protein